MIHSLMLADDVAIVANRAEEAQMSLARCTGREYCKVWALSVNPQKNKVMKLGRGEMRTYI